MLWTSTVRALDRRTSRGHFCRQKLWGSVLSWLLLSGCSDRYPMRPWIFIAVAAMSLAACTANQTKLNSDDGEEDAGASAQLLPPVLNDVPSSTPNETVAIRGTSDGKRIVVQGGSAGTTITSILPGGSFCSDVGLKAGEPVTLTVYAMGDGLLSESTELVVTRDSAAPPPPSPTCSGGTPQQCDRPEVCDSGEDENCDGWVDICDLECSQCVDDSLEPNDFAINVPTIPQGNHDLAICPCREDWFAFQRQSGESIRVSADFSHEAMNLNLRLYQATETGEQGDFVAGSFSTTDRETIDELIDADGLYYLRVYAFGNDGQSSGTYQLTVE